MHTISKRTSNVRLVVPTFLCFCVLLLSAVGRASTVVTDDGLSLNFNDADASITSVAVGGTPLKLNNSPGGFYVADMVGDKLLGKMDYKSEAFPGTRLNAASRSSPTGVVVQGKVNDLWVRARIEPRGDYLAVTGDLVNLRPEQDRAVILYFRIPIDAGGASWGKNLGVEEKIEPRRRPSLSQSVLLSPGLSPGDVATADCDNLGQELGPFAGTADGQASLFPHHSR